MTMLPPPLMTEELPLRLEPEELSGGEQFHVDSRTEIESLLTQLAQRKELICLYIDASENFDLSAAIAVSGDQLILDLPRRGMGDAILLASQVLCVSNLHRVKLQFESRAPRRVEWEGRPALALSLPSQLLRFQRRDFYRLTVPLGHPLSCYIPTGRGDEVEISLVDISVGGIGILGYAPGIRLSGGLRYQNIRIELPGTGTIVGTVEVRASFDVTLKNGIRTVRTGAQFISLPGTSQALIQRYITRIERERIARQQHIIGP